MTVMERGRIHLSARLSPTEVNKCIRMTKETQELKIFFTKN
jgi:hypothetical protein